MSQPCLETIDTSTLDAITGGSSQSGADYQCGPYRLELKGAESATLFRNGKQVERYETEASTPTVLDNRGNMFFARNGAAFKCQPLNTGR